MRPLKPFASIEAMARFCHEWLRDALTTMPKGHVFHIALSGGSTPAALFDALVALEREGERAGKPALPWHRVRFFWGDERCVSPYHADSNYRMTLEHLFEPLGIHEAQVYRIRGESDPQEEADRYALLLQALLPLTDGVPCFDLIVLGLGDDGHTASIFPGQNHLFDTSRLCAPVHHPVTGQARVTLCGRVINHARLVVFLVTGAAKASMVARVQGQMVARGADVLPAARVAPVSGRLYWLLDAAAATELPDTATTHKDTDSSDADRAGTV